MMPPRATTKPFQCIYQAARQRLISKSAPETQRRGPQLLAYSTRSQLARPTSSSFLAKSETSSLHRQQYRWKSHISSSTAHARSKTGPISFVSVALFVATGAGVYFYFQYEKARMERQRITEASKGMGKPKVGGQFVLQDQNGQAWSSEKMKGKFALVYFGFTHCPDICPEELDKMAVMLDLAEEKIPSKIPRNPDLVPIFITCDPARDTPAVLKTYLQEFHPKLIGLTGTWDQIKAVCKLYRVYFSTPPGVKPGEDYLVDHSIYFYLMDPDGDFVEAIGRQHSAEDAAKLITDHMADWKGNLVKD